ncbi:MAG: choice-of-anchor Q domain-containing protein [Caldilineaceae bacterium]
MNNRKQLPKSLARVGGQVGITLALLALCFYAFGWQAKPAEAGGSILRVPDDYATIQAAIDAAHDGDTIQVAATDENGEEVTYQENLVISKSLTLIGSLTANYEPTRTVATIDGQSSGRTVWIAPPQPPAGALAQNGTLSVTLDGFAIGHGDATGLGGAYWIAAEVPTNAAAAAFPPKLSYSTAAQPAGEGLLAGNNGVPLDVGAWAGDAAARLDRLQQQGLLPLDAAEYAALQARMQELTSGAQQAVAAQAAAQLAAAANSPAPAAAPAFAPVAAEDAPSYDCGGGIYSIGAGLVLHNLAVYNNYGHRQAASPYAAEAQSSGYGGGICIVDAPANSVTINHVTVAANVASNADLGVGGGMLIQNTIGAALSALEVEKNIALVPVVSGAHNMGLGGGLALINAHGTRFSESEGDKNKFDTNVATTSDLGLGGGIYIADSDQVSIDSLVLYGNIAGGGSLNSIGTGGGLRVFESNMLELTDSAFAGNVACLSGPAQGGAIAAFKSQEVAIAHSTFERNTGSQGPGYGIGGGIYLEKINGAHLIDNQMLANVGATYPDVTGMGGAVGVWDSTDISAIGNTFAQNVGAAAGIGHGGAVIINKTQAITIYDNQFNANWAAMFGILASTGGGLEVGGTESTVVAGNTFSANMGVLYTGDLGSTAIAEGGALAAFAVDTMAVATNVFSGNVALTSGITGFGSEGNDGGAVAINRGKPKSGLGSQAADPVGASTDVAVFGNRFINNLAVVEDVGASPINAGGGLRLTAVRAQVLDNHFVGNRTCGVCSGTNNGGALAVLPAIEENYVTSADNIVDGNTFSGNWGRMGSAALIVSNLFTVTNNVFAGNQATGPNAAALGLSVYLLPEDLPSAQVANNTLYNNVGGAAMTFEDWDESVSAVINNVVVSNTLAITTEKDSTLVQLDYNLFNNNGADVGGPGTITNSHPITGAVRFVDAAGGIFNLMPNSLAIDAGDPAGTPPAPDHDIDWVDRPYGARVDVGAYEWHGQGATLPFVRK